MAKVVKIKRDNKVATSNNLVARLLQPNNNISAGNYWQFDDNMQNVGWFPYISDVSTWDGKTQYRWYWDISIGDGGSIEYDVGNDKFRQSLLFDQSIGHANINVDDPSILTVFKPNANAHFKGNFPLGFSFTFKTTGYDGTLIKFGSDASLSGDMFFYVNSFGGLTGVRYGGDCYDPGYTYVSDWNFTTDFSINDGEWHSLAYDQTVPHYSYIYVDSSLVFCNAGECNGLGYTVHNKCITPTYIKLGEDFNGNIDKLEINGFHTGISKYPYKTVPDFPTNGLVSRYMFDGDLTDSWGNNDLSVHTGSASYTTGKIGQCVTFSSDIFEQDGSAMVNLMNTGIYSVSLWFKTTDDNPTYKTLWMATDYISFQKGGRLEFIGDDVVVSKPRILWEENRLDISTNFHDGEWHHLAASYENGTFFSGLYDGQYFVSDGSGADGGLSTGMYIGGMPTPDPYSQQNFMIGEIDLLYIYNRPLSKGEMTTLYNLGLGC